MMPRSVLQALLNSISSDVLLKDLSWAMEEVLIKSGYATVTSMETFVYPRTMEM